MLSLSEIASLSREIDRELKEKKLLDVKQISEKQWVLIFSDGKKLIIALKYPFETIHLSQGLQQGAVTPFTNCLNKSLLNFQVDDVNLMNSDRIVVLSLIKGNLQKRLIIELIPRRGKIVLIDENQHILCTPHLVGKRYDFPEKKVTQEINIQEVTSQEIEKRFLKSDVERRKLLILERLDQKREKLKKLLERYEEQLNGPKRAEQIYKEAQLLQSHFHQIKPGMKKISLLDWETGQDLEIDLEENISLTKQLEKKFRKVRKLKEGAKHAVILKEQAQKEIDLLAQKIRQVEEAEDLDAFEVKSPIKKVKKQKVPFRCYYSESGLAIYVGMNAKQNEELSFRFARGNDTWLHCADYPGSHVIIRSNEVDKETLDDAMQIAVHYSKAQGEKEADVIVTKSKEVHKMRGGKPGSARLGKHKKIRVRFDPMRFKRVALRKEPHPLP